MAIDRRQSLPARPHREIVPIYFDSPIVWEEAADLETPRFSKRAVERAGKLLRGRIGAVDEAALEAFEIAHNWRNAHVLPMRRMRNELSFKAKRVNPGSVTAGRLKRMKSIRRKLARLPYTLYQMQDIGGCRAIVASVGDIDRVVASYDAECKHDLLAANDYLSNPKVGGYRSHHRVYRFDAAGEFELFRHQLIEVQIRTQLQHAWATAVEAVGLVRGEDLKGGEGNVDWLRFFSLMSAEFAVEEGCPIVPGISESHKERRAEIVDLNARLAAVVNLDSYVRIIQTTETMAARSGQIFMIQYDPARHEVGVRSFPNYAAGSRRYELEEARQSGGMDTVLVEVDRAADLRSAYPNYYLDVGMFLGRLRNVLEGRPSGSGGSKARTVAPSKRPAFDLDWWFKRVRP